MNRTIFYNKVTNDSIQELDFLHNTLSEFETNYPTKKYRVSGTDLLRPDLISYKAYGTVQFWWVIMTVNGITNPFTDLEVGDILEIPSKLDIFDFQRKYRLRRSNR